MRIHIPHFQSVVCVFSHWYSFDFPAEMCFFKCICHLLHRFFTEANLIFASSGLIVSLFHDFVFPYAWHGSPHVLWTVAWEVHMIVIPTIVGRDPLDWPQWLSYCWLQQMSWVVFKIYAGKHFFYTFFLPSQMMSCYVFFSLASTKDFLSAKSENNEVSTLWMEYFMRQLSSVLILKRSWMSFPSYYHCQTSAHNQELPTLPHSPNCIILHSTQMKTHRILATHVTQQKNSKTDQIFTEE